MAKLPELRWLVAGRTHKKRFLVSACGRFSVANCRLHDCGCCLLHYVPDGGKAATYHFDARDDAMHWARKKAAG